MTKNIYFNNAIIGNGKVTLGLDTRGKLLRAYFPQPDFKSQISDIYIAFKIYDEMEENEYIHVCGEEYNTDYEQKYVQDTNILKTNMYILDKDISIMQTDFAPLNENMCIRNYEIKNSSNKKIIIYTKNEEETKELGRIIAKLVKEEIRKKKSLIHIALVGDLGVRKNEDNRRNIKRIWNGRTNI